MNQYFLKHDETILTVKMEKASAIISRSFFATYSKYPIKIPSDNNAPKMVLVCEAAFIAGIICGGVEFRKNSLMALIGFGILSTIRRIHGEIIPIPINVNAHR